MTVTAFAGRQRLLEVLLLLLTLLLPAGTLSAAAGTRILLVARDLDDNLLAGFRFVYAGFTSQATSDAGATELDLPPDHPEGRQIKLQLKSGSKQAEEWLLVPPEINIPSAFVPAEVLLMRRSTLRQIGEATLDAPRQAPARPSELTAEDRKRALVAAAAQHGLTAEQLETAIRSFAETQDTKDRGIAAYLQGQYVKAEELLDKADEKQESGLVETLWFRGAAQYEQAKYQAAADSFRKALAARPEDAVLLGSLGDSLRELAQWAEAESLMRRALAIDEKLYGPQDSHVSTRLNNLALLLLATNRFAEAETLMRRALAIAEKSFGPEHPTVAIRLDNLAQLLEATSRLAEAEPLTRRALAIDEKSYGPEHPEVAIHLDNLAQLLQDTNRLAEAEPLMRRALAIGEKSYGPEHPRVALRLNNLAQLLEAANRLAEAEPLMRRALTIDEKSYGPEHPTVAIDLSNLASLLYTTDRLAEAEPLMRRALAIDEKSHGPEHSKVAIRLNNLALLLLATNRPAEAESLMRRALAIDEKSYGPEHPDVAVDLNNLAALLQETNHLAEAEPLRRRGLVILLGFSRRTGHEHPEQGTVLRSYRELLGKMGKSQAEIDAAIAALARPPA